MTRKTSRDPGVRPPIVHVYGNRRATLYDGWWRAHITNEEHDVTKTGVIRLVKRWGYDVARTRDNHSSPAWKPLRSGGFERELKRKESDQ